MRKQDRALIFVGLVLSVVTIILFVGGLNPARDAGDQTRCMLMLHCVYLYTAPRFDLLPFAFYGALVSFAVVGYRLFVRSDKGGDPPSTPRD